VEVAVSPGTRGTRTGAVRQGGFKALPIDPRKIAEASKIKLMPWKPDKLGISGFLMRAGENFGIGYSTAIENPGFINFTTAHELGHHFLSGHVEALLERRRNALFREWICLGQCP
jgi:hypothetical protein